MRRPAAAAILLGAAATLAAGAAHLFLYAPEAAIAPPAALAEAAARVSTSTLPARLAIPAIGVDAPIDPLGIVAGDRMQAPANFTDVGWYKYGVVPGSPGIAVLYAHLDNGLGLSGVFKDLDRLKAGDELTLTRKDGATLRFKVSDVETYPYDAVPPAAIGESSPGPGPADPARVVLITCAGEPTHDPSMGFTYDHRLLVTATLEP
ncbi:MAG TPA: class F sortase [Candidatus Paceibacterota bacterium]|nr:class F sortase [Candidatus Paceibacterota bacterium]